MASLETDLLVGELIGRAHIAAAEAINAAAEAVFTRSQQRVPRSEAHAEKVAREGGNYPEKPLSDSGEVILATPDSLVATVIYRSPYAASQEIGEMVYDSSRAGRPVDWQAKQYTTPGTGPRYLDTSVKEILPGLPGELEVQARVQFGGA